jgi:hypothetical protein
MDECTFDDCGNVVMMSELIEDETERDPQTDKIVFPNEKTAQAVRALTQLIQLRDYYRQGWTPDWTDDQSKYVIEYYDGNVYGETYTKRSAVLSFQSPPVMLEFMKNFADLIEQAKELL